MSAEPPPGTGAGAPPAAGRAAEAAPRLRDLRGPTITTAIVLAVREELADLAVGDEIELLIEPFPAIVPDLEAWCRATGHDVVETLREGESRRVRLRKGVPRRNDHRLATVVSWLARPFSRFARAGLERTGHVAPPRSCGNSRRLAPPSYA